MINPDVFRRQTALVQQQIERCQTAKELQEARVLVLLLLLNGSKLCGPHSLLFKDTLRYLVECLQVQCRKLLQVYCRQLPNSTNN